MTDAGIVRSKKLMLLSHCVLNQNAVICGWERASGAFSCARELIDSGVGIIQLPCPELLYGGCGRPPKTYGEYNTAPYRELCRALAEPVVKQLTEYLGHGYRYLGIIGIENSPTCSLSGQRGVLMEELFRFFSQAGIDSPYLEIPEAYRDNQTNRRINMSALLNL